MAGLAAGVRLCLLAHEADRLFTLAGLYWLFLRWPTKGAKPVQARQPATCKRHASTLSDGGRDLIKKEKSKITENVIKKGMYGKVIADTLGAGKRKRAYINRRDSLHLRAA